MNVGTQPVICCLSLAVKQFYCASHITPFQVHHDLCGRELAALMALCQCYPQGGSTCALSRARALINQKSTLKLVQQMATPLSNQSSRGRHNLSKMASFDALSTSTRRMYSYASLELVSHAPQCTLYPSTVGDLVHVGVVLSGERVDVLMTQLLDALP